jgi:hypothetical protein
MIIRVLDPTHERTSARIEPAPRLSSLEGKVIGFISNGKEGTKGYFAHVERLMRKEFRVADVEWRTKKNFSAPAAADIVDDIKRWQAVVTGVGD